MKPPQAQIRLNRVKFAKDCARPKRFGSRAPSEFLTWDDSQRRFFSHQRSNVGTMLQPYETMSQQCGNDMLR